MDRIKKLTFLQHAIEGPHTTTTRSAPSHCIASRSNAMSVQHSDPTPLRGRPRLADPVQMLPPDASAEEVLQAKRLQRRRLLNRESARRSRARHTELLAEALQEVKELQQDRIALLQVSAAQQQRLLLCYRQQHQATQAWCSMVERYSKMLAAHARYQWNT